MSKTKLPRSSAFPTGGKTGKTVRYTTRYLLDYLEPREWEQTRAKAAAEGISVRTLILTLLRRWREGKIVLPKDV